MVVEEVSELLVSEGIGVDDGSGEVERGDETVGKGSKGRVGGTEGSGGTTLGGWKGIVAMDDGRLRPGNESVDMMSATLSQC